MSLLFFVGLTLALTAIFIPKTFEVLTEFAFEETGFAKELKTTDEVLTTVSETSDSIQDSIGKIFGQKDSEDKKAEVNLYDDFIKFLAGILRWITFILAILIMVLSTYLRYAFASVYDVKELRRRVYELEHRVGRG